jgi:hypothetical protein
MRDAIRRALKTPPPRGAVIVVAIGLLVTLAAIVLSKDPGGSGEDVGLENEKTFADSPTVTLPGGGNAKIVDGAVTDSATNDLSQRIYRIEASFRVNAGSPLAIDQIRCQLTYPAGVELGLSDGRDAAFPRPLEDTADDAIKEAASVDFDTEDSSKAAVPLRNKFFKYVVGGNPSVSWPSLAEGQNAWLWRYPKPVKQTRVNFAVLAIAKGGQSVPIVCLPHQVAAIPGGPSTSGGPLPASPARTVVKLPD